MCWTTTKEKHDATARQPTAGLHISASPIPRPLNGKAGRIEGDVTEGSDVVKSIRRSAEETWKTWLVIHSWTTQQLHPSRDDWSMMVVLMETDETRDDGFVDGGGWP